MIRKLVEKGINVFVLAPRDPYTERFEKIPGLTFIPLRHLKARSISPLQDIRLRNELLTHYRLLRPDLIFHYTIKANIFGSLAAASAGIPAISVVTGLGYAFSGKGLLQCIARILYRLALRKTKEVWFLNEDDRDLFTGLQLIPAEKTFILPGEGVDTTAFYPAPFQPQRKEITFLLIARVIRHKGIYEFAQAAELLRGLAVRCQLLGFFDDNNPLSIPRKDIDEWQLDHTLTYLGYADDVPPFIEQADCIVLPSYREGMPLSLLEGASMCKALIAADAPGCRSLIDDGITGFLCRTKDSQDLAAKMLAYCQLTPEAKRQMGIAAREKVLSGFTNEQVMAIYLEKIDKLAAPE